MNLGQKISYFFVRLFCLTFSALPYWVVYHLVLDFLYFILYKVARYRVRIVRINLKNSFPEYSVQQRLEIEKRYYKHLSELFIDTLVMVGVSEKTLRKRIHFLNLDEHLEQTKGKDFIAALGHYGSWELATSYQIFDSIHSEQIVYRPLHSKVFDVLFQRFRTKFGASVVPMADVMRHIIKLRADKTEGQKPFVLALVSDQVPPKYFHPMQFEFLSQPTTFFMGVEKMALRFKVPVYFLDVEKVARGCYNFTYQMIYDGEQEVPEGEITQRYINKLEAMIRRTPELWLWSHRRWKHNKSTQCL